MALKWFNGAVSNEMWRWPLVWEGHGRK